MDASLQSLTKALELSEDKIDTLYTQRDEAISEGKFDLIANLNISINVELEYRDELDALIKQKKKASPQRGF